MVVGAAVSISAHKELIQGKLKKQIGSPYSLAVVASAQLMGKWANQYGYSEPIPHIIDRGHRNCGEAELQFQIQRADEPSRIKWHLGPLTAEDDTKAIPLQAADLVAYEAWKFMHQGGNEANRNLEQFRYPFRRLFTNNLHPRIRIFDREVLQDYVNRFG
jgi:hypothetical protein